MLPFLKKSQEASASNEIEHMKVGSKDEAYEAYDPMEAAAEDLLAAINKKDHKGMALALKAAFQLMELEPHEEAEHE